MMDKVPKNMSVSVNFPGALYFLLISWSLKLGLTGCPEMLVRNYHSMLCNMSGKRKPHMIWWCRPLCGSAWTGSVRSSSALHMRI